MVRASTESSTTRTRIFLFIDHIKGRLSFITLLQFSPLQGAGLPVPRYFCFWKVEGATVVKGEFLLRFSEWLIMK